MLQQSRFLLSFVVCSHFLSTSRLTFGNRHFLCYDLYIKRRFFVGKEIARFSGSMVIVKSMHCSLSLDSSMLITDLVHGKWFNMVTNLFLVVVKGLGHCRREQSLVRLLKAKKKVFIPAPRNQAATTTTTDSPFSASSSIAYAKYTHSTTM